MSAPDKSQKQQSEKPQPSPLYSKLFEINPVAAGITRFDTGLIVDVNEAWQKLFGYSREEAIGRSAEDLSLWALPSDRRQFMAELKDKGFVHDREYGILRKSGEPLIALCSAESLQVGEQAYAISTWMDITQRRQADEALRQSEFQYRLIAENIEDVIWLLDLKTQRLTYISPSIKKLRGYTPEEVMALPFTASLTPESAQKVQDLVRFYLPKFQQNPNIQFSITTELDQYRKDGSIVHTEITTTPLINDQERLELVGVSRNNTDRKHSEEEKARLSAQLQQAQKMESVGRLAGGVAHDFNNMLGVILGHVELAQDQLDPSHPVYSDLREIQQAAQRSADLTRQLLAFARRQAVTPKILDLNETVSGMIKMLQRLIGEDIRIEWHPGSDLGKIHIDPAQIDQIMANLAANARDAIQGIGTLSIETAQAILSQDYCQKHTSLVPGNYVRLRVSDTGRGMDEETLNNIFEPFFTTKGIGKGMGLGLATIYGIVKQNGGCIDVQSQSGIGTSFDIFLPCYPEGSEPSPAETAPPSSVRKTILLVEDEPSILQLTKRMLEKMDYTVLAAASPAEAIRAAKEAAAKIEILISDVIMPEMNGRDLAKELTALYPQLRCIFMSGWTADIIANQGITEPAALFLQKPFSSKELKAVLQQIQQ